MWWERWIPQSYLTKSAVCAIACVFGETGLRYRYVILQRRGGKLEISREGESQNLDEVLALAGKASAPSCLVLTGKGVMLKKIMLGVGETPSPLELLAQHLPAIQAADFFVQFYPGGQQWGYLALCRKDQLNQLTAHFAGKKTELANVFLGAAVCQSLAPLTAPYNRLTTADARLELASGYLEDILPLGDTEPVSLQADGLSVPPDLLLAFSAGFAYLTRQQVYESPNEEISRLERRHSESIRLRLLVFVFIAILFVVSGINSVLFFQKFEEQTAIDVELSLYESKNSQITKLLDEYQKKKSLIEQAGVFRNKKISVYADKIAATLPADIVLRELYFNPEDGETEQDSLAEFRQNELIIKGNCNKSLLLNDWVNVLKSQSFVKSVNLENYIFSSEGHLPNFVLKLKTD